MPNENERIAIEIYEIYIYWWESDMRLLQISNININANSIGSKLIIGWCLFAKSKHVLLCFSPPLGKYSLIVRCLNAFSHVRCTKLWLIHSFRFFVCHVVEKNCFDIVFRMLEFERILCFYIIFPFKKEVFGSDLY